MKRFIATFAGIVLMVALTACGVTVHTDHDFIGGNPCGPNDKWLLIDITSSLPVGDEDDPEYVDPGEFVNVLFDAESPDPNYGGVIYVGVGLSSSNPEILEAATPYFANVCFPADKPVAIMVRAWLAADRVQRASLTLRCHIHENDLVGPGEQLDEVTTDSSDLIAPGTHGYDVGTQCVYRHVPGGWTGPGIPDPPFPLLERDR